MTLVQLETLLAVVESGSFSKAAILLNMTQSAVTHNIKNLESELGLQLVVRNRSGVTLTHFGERTVNHAKQMQFHSRCIVEEASALCGVHEGTIRVATVSSVYATFISEFIKHFNTSFPSVHLVLFEGTRDDVVSWIHNGVVDVGFVSICDDMKDPIRTLPLMRDYMSVLLPANHPCANAAEISMDDLAQYPFIMPKMDSDDFLEKYFEERGVALDVRFTVRDTATILAMVSQGLGLTLMPQTSIPQNMSNICMITPAFRSYRVVGLGVPAHTETSPLVQEFLKHAQSYVRGRTESDDTRLA